MYFQGRLHTTEYIFILQASYFGSILSHLQAFSKKVNTEILKLHYDVNLPFTLQYIINMTSVFVYIHVDNLSNNT
jgi:hypothetical protein